MKGILAGLLVAFVVLVLALIVATVGSVGVALIGMLLHRWFDLTQWQGSLIAVIVGAGLSLVVYRTVAAASIPSTYTNDWDDEDEEEDDDEVEEKDEPPIVAWRRNRPTPGELPSEKPANAANRSAGKKK